MRLPRLFTLLFALSFGLALAAQAYGPLLQGTALEAFAPPDVTYTTPNTSFLPGDILFGLGKVFEWLGKTPAIATQLIAALGVPQPWASALVFLVLFSFAAYIIYFISGRIIAAYM